MSNTFSSLPSVDRLISDKRISSLAGDYPHELFVSLARQQLKQAREAIAGGRESPTENKLVNSILAQLHRLDSPSLRPVINATGVILHTNLGRAPLSPETITAMDTITGGYTNLEFNLGTGSRGTRHAHIEGLLCQLSGAEAALVVNNNASAVLLSLTALARRREVVVSRGEAVEIGDSFRIPDVMRQSGAKLVEVGTTNCTYIGDYEQAITQSTAALMRVHSSNFQVVGFTHSTALDDLTALGRQYDLPVLDDLGSGCFLKTEKFGLDSEPMVQQSISAGVGLVFFSGDKLVGGPQAGVILGRKDLIDRLKKHPLARAVRIDKIRLAGLAATLVHYLKDEALEKVPVWRMIAASKDEVGRRAETWAKALGKNVRVIDGGSTIGGGSLPGGTLPTKLVAIGEGGKKAGSTVQALSARLRSNDRCPVIGRISDNVLLLDPRSVLPEEDEILLEVFRENTTG